MRNPDVSKSKACSNVRLHLEMETLDFNVFRCRHYHFLVIQHNEKSILLFHALTSDYLSASPETDRYSVEKALKHVVASFSDGLSGAFNRAVPRNYIQSISSRPKSVEAQQQHHRGSAHRDLVISHYNFMASHDI
jgi:hypothetical protein